jgi:hypothetical protein
MRSEDSQDLTPVQQLLRMKRQETPSDEFVESFLAEFKERQRSEMLRQSARGLLWERWMTYWDDRAGQKWALAGVAAAILLGMGWLMVSGSSEETASMRVVADGSGMSDEPQSEANSVFAAEAILIMGEDVEGSVEESPLLLSRHFAGGYADEAREIKAMVHPESAVGETSGRIEGP